MLQWVEAVWKPFAQKYGGASTLLIVDQMSAHLVPSMKRSIEACGTLLEFVPKGYTSYL